MIGYIIAISSLIGAKVHKMLVFDVVETPSSRKLCAYDYSRGDVHVSNLKG